MTSTECTNTSSRPTLSTCNSVKCFLATQHCDETSYGIHLRCLHLGFGLWLDQREMIGEDRNWLDLPCRTLSYGRQTTCRHTLTHTRTHTHTHTTHTHTHTHKHTHTHSHTHTHTLTGSDCLPCSKLSQTDMNLS